MAESLQIGEEFPQDSVFLKSEWTKRCLSESVTCDFCTNEDNQKNFILVSEISNEKVRSYILENIKDTFSANLSNESLICINHIKVFEMIMTAKGKNLISSSQQNAMTGKTNQVLDSKMKNLECF